MFTALLRLVLDTSVIVAAFRSRTGAGARLLELLAEGRFVAVATPTLLLEYESVLRLPEQRMATDLSEDQVEDIMQALAALIVPIRVDFQWRPQMEDPDDGMVLEAAINSSSYAIVTHNVRHFERAARNFNIRVVPPGVILKKRGFSDACMHHSCSVARKRRPRGGRPGSAAWCFA